MKNSDIIKETLIIFAVLFVTYFILKLTCGETRFCLNLAIVLTVAMGAVYACYKYVKMKV